MKKKELIALLVIPVVLLALSITALIWSYDMGISAKKRIQLLADPNIYIKKIQSETPEVTQNNLITYISKMNKVYESTDATEYEYTSLFSNLLIILISICILWLIIAVSIFKQIKYRETNTSNKQLKKDQ